MQRRSVLGAIGASPLITAPFVARAETGMLSFRALRQGQDIGRHSIRFEKVGDEVAVDIEIDFEVRLLLIPVYTYTHRNAERWDRGVLQGFTSQTDDNGKEFQVEARQASDVIIAETGDARYEHPPQRRPTTYWHKSFLQDTQWIDTQKGGLIDCSLLTRDERELVIMGKSVRTEHFVLGGDLALELWYAGDHWVRLSFQGEDGSLIEYELEEFMPIDMRFA